jgi:hypothetical protein
MVGLQGIARQHYQPESTNMETVKSLLGAGGGGGEGEIPEVPKTGDMPSREEMLKTIESLQKAQKAQSTANSLKEKAMAMTNSTQREKMLKEAFDKEMEAHGHSKMAKRLQSGSWQGFGFGGGIGAASGLGTGAALGTLLGGILMVPTTGLGMLIGTGVGAVHGPFVKLAGGKDGKTEEVPFEDADPGRVVDAIEAQRNAQPTNQESAAPSGNNDDGEKEEQKPRRKPPKLEVRSKRATDAGGDSKAEKESSVTTGVSEESKPPRRKPKKLEIRSGKNGVAKTASA